MNSVTCELYPRNDSIVETRLLSPKSNPLLNRRFYLKHEGQRSGKKEKEKEEVKVTEEGNFVKRLAVQLRGHISQISSSSSKCHS